MQIEEMFLKRRSTREFSEKQIDDETLESICKLAVLAPSAVNLQPYNLFAVNGKKAAEFTPNVQIDGANGWASGAKAYIVIEERAPHSVITRDGRTISNAPFIANDVGILSAFIVLAAESMGLGSCIIGIRNEKGIAKFLDLPENSLFPLVIALGYPANDCRAKERRRRDFNKTYKLIK